MSHNYVGGHCQPHFSRSSLSEIPLTRVKVSLRGCRSEEHFDPLYSPILLYLFIIYYIFILDAYYLPYLIEYMAHAIGSMAFHRAQKTLEFQGPIPSHFLS
jgi:hypothetical protein